MKRIGIIVALPLLLIFVWAISDTAKPSNVARLVVETDDVRGTRNDIVTKLTEAGAAVRSETGAGEDDGSTVVTFELAAGAVDSAVASIHTTATVVEKEVDLSVSFSDVKSVEAGLDTLDSCLDRAQQHVESSASAAAKSSIAECRAQLDRTLARVEANNDLAEPMQLDVEINKRGGHSVLLIFLTLGIVVTLAFVAARLLRVTRQETVVDIRRRRPVSEELYERRN